MNAAGATWLRMLARGGARPSDVGTLVMGSLFMAAALFGVYVAISRQSWARRLIVQFRWGRAARAPRMRRAGCFLSSVALGTFAATAIFGGHYRLTDNSRTPAWLMSAIGMMIAAAVFDLLRRGIRRADRQARRRYQSVELASGAKCRHEIDRKD